MQLKTQSNLGSKQELSVYENVQFVGHETTSETKPPTPKGFLHKFRKSISLSAESACELTQSLGKTKSTFYLTETIDIDTEDKTEDNSRNDSGLPSSPVQKNRSSILVRPNSPPPPIPTQNNSG